MSDVVLKSSRSFLRSLLAGIASAFAMISAARPRAPADQSGVAARAADLDTRRLAAVRFVRYY
jgi:hypothetical protein